MLAVLVALGLVAVAAALAQGDGGGDGAVPPPLPPPAGNTPAPAPSPAERIRWHRSVAAGKAWKGRLLNGVRLPSEGADFFTWDPIEKSAPNRSWRRWGTDRLVRVLLRVLREHRAAFPGAPRVGIGDLSRPRGGDFGPRFGGIGHASHQNGLDVDVYYPRLDGLERRAARVGQVDLELAQDLVDRFVAEGAEYVFVGPRTGLAGPRKRVQALRNHDDHLHVRIHR